ncbi:hypothetical protein VTN77DRAFT_4152 [Rasamsonia byssochlamydoides]|uniref:uncharacterized protein n=1 Tax=Rasamsonia byssochlamydoides TaxID=89139 RepID=UPI00374269D9
MGHGLHVHGRRAGGAVAPAATPKQASRKAIWRGGSPQDAIVPPKDPQSGTLLNVPLASQCPAPPRSKESDRNDWGIRPVDPNCRHRGTDRLDKDTKKKMPVEMPRIFRDEDRQANVRSGVTGVVARRAWSAACMTLCQ